MWLYRIAPVSVWARTFLQYCDTCLRTRPRWLRRRQATRVPLVFFSEFGWFILYQFTTARLMYGTLFALSLSLAWFVHRERVPGSRLRSKTLTTIGDFWMAQWNGVRAHIVASGGALIGASGLAGIMHRTP